MKTLQNRPRNVHKSPEILLHPLETIFRGTEVTIWLFEKIGEIGTFVKSAVDRPAAGFDETVFWFESPKMNQFADQNFLRLAKRIRYNMAREKFRYSAYFLKKMFLCFFPKMTSSAGGRPADLKKI